MKGVVLLTFVILLAFAFYSNAQTLSGTVKDESNSEPLIGANVVIKGAKPDPERVLLSTKNLDVALSFDASVVFAMQTDTDDVEHVTNRLNLAKQAYIHSPGTAVGFVLDGGDAGAGAAIAEKTGLVYFGTSQTSINTDLLLKKPGGRMSPARRCQTPLR